jgi:RNA polymerase-binding transcription factor DksA
MNVIRERLERRLEELNARSAKIEADFRNPEDRQGQRSQASEHEEVLGRLSEAESIEMEEIRSALLRIERGSYGICQRCDGEIGDRRLSALPYARFCIDCAE